MKNKASGILELATAAPGGSDLLKTMDRDDFALLLPHLRTKAVERGAVLCEAGQNVDYVYFPLGDALVSFRVFLKNNGGVEVMVIGREGAGGGIVSHGKLPAYCQFLVQSAGTLAYISCAELRRAREKSPSLDNFFARYADCLLAQIFQTAACNATHTIQQRAAKWLAATLRRTGDPVMMMTQDDLATMLGVGRSYVAKVMGGMKRQGVLTMSRGRLTIRDEKKLKKLCCKCEDLVQDHFAAVLAGSYAKPGK